MDLLTATILFSLALAADYIRTGTLYIPQLFCLGIPNALNIERNKIFVAEEVTFYFFDARGTLESTITGKYLTFNGAGKLVLEEQPDRNFGMRSHPGMYPRRTVVYKGEAIFELCADGSIGYESECEDAVGVTITYEDYIH
ncbi:hypothetical protein JCM33374_g1407 [Metschnikowia sp. JCM 33374]|nr:hypothetical protein JCM33374_g1407 [Metschnikowia sp. JCM 33374]